MPARPQARGPITDARLRIVAALVLAFCYSALHGAAALALMGGVTLALVVLSGTRIARLLHRLRLPGVVILGLIAVLPFASGATIVADLGPLALRAEGLASAAGIALRFLCIFTVILVFLDGVPLPQLITGLRGLGLPPLMVDMALLTLRHIADLRAALARREVALRLRAEPRGAWRTIVHARGWMLGSLLLHSHDRSERVWQAMRLRGHGAPGASVPDPVPLRAGDIVWLAVLISAAAGLMVVEHAS